MLYLFKEDRINAYFSMTNDHQRDSRYLEDIKELFTIFWNQSAHPISIKLDEQPYTIRQGQIFTVTYLQKLKIDIKNSSLTSFNFNREFYCIKDHDDEVSCNGMLFYGNHQVPIVSIPEEEKSKFDLLHQVFEEEFQNRDNIQSEMLQMLLKRLIIKVTRLAKNQLFEERSSSTEIELIRQFNILLDKHYKTHKQVSDYADMLYKSPKTLANTFTKLDGSSPLQLIHNRIVMEAKRLLIYTDYSVKEVAYQLGYQDDGPFHKLFKRATQMTPQAFKTAGNLKIGKN